MPWFARILRETFAEKPNDAPPPTIMTSPLNGGTGLAEKSGLETADACDTNASEMSADTTAHFIFVARNSFTEASDMVVQYVVCFSRSISSANRFAWKIPVTTLA